MNAISIILKSHVSYVRVVRIRQRRRTSAQQSPPTCLRDYFSLEKEKMFRSSWEVSINNNNKAAAERKAKIKIKKFFECMLLFEVPEHRLVSRIWHLSAVESFLETNSHAHCLSSSRRDQSTVTFCFYLPSLLTPSENKATTLMVHGKLHE